MIDPNKVQRVQRLLQPAPAARPPAREPSLCHNNLCHNPIGSKLKPSHSAGRTCTPPPRDATAVYTTTFSARGRPHMNRLSTQSRLCRGRVHYRTVHCVVLGSSSSCLLVPFGAFWADAPARGRGRGSRPRPPAAPRTLRRPAPKAQARRPCVGCAIGRWLLGGGGLANDQQLVANDQWPIIPTCL